MRIEKSINMENVMVKKLIPPRRIKIKESNQKRIKIKIKSKMFLTRGMGWAFKESQN